MSDQAPLLKDPTIKACAFVCFVLFGGFLLWAGFVKLDEGVAASGQIIVEDNRRVIQHLEGGIVESVAVSEGSQVEQGDTLLVLTNVAGQAAKSELIYNTASLAASIFRLDAQSADLAHLDFSNLETYDLPLAERDSIFLRETELFEQETATLTAEVNVLRERARNARVSVKVILTQQIAANTALTALQDQLKRKQHLADLQLVRLDEVRLLERDIAATHSDIARLQNEINNAESGAIDFRNQIFQVNAKYKSMLAEQRVETLREFQSSEERLIAAKDVMNRTIITAPQSGKILNLTAHTIGGIIRAGDPIMEIVPASQSIIASVRINPSDRASVLKGLVVRAQITAFDNRDVPELLGEIIDISADLISDLQTQTSYYDVRIRLADVPSNSVMISPGLPVSVFIFSGAKRTTLEHILDPLNESIFAGLRGR